MVIGETVFISYRLEVWCVLRICINFDLRFLNINYSNITFNYACDTVAIIISLQIINEVLYSSLN